MADTDMVPTWPERFTAADATFLTWSAVPAAALPALLARLDLADITATAQEAPLRFYEDGRLIAVSRPSEAQDLFFLLPPGTEPAVQQLDGTNEPVYAYNEANGITLAGAAAFEYLRFFFHFVRGRLGCFHIVENIGDILWCPDTPDSIQTEAAALLMPLTARGAHRSGLLRYTATVVFKNALFKTDIYLAPRPVDNALLPGDDAPQRFSLGQAALHGEDLLMEDLPVDGYC